GRGGGGLCGVGGGGGVGAERHPTAGRGGGVEDGWVAPPWGGGGRGVPPPPGGGGRGGRGRGGGGGGAGARTVAPHPARAFSARHPLPANCGERVQTEFAAPADSTSHDYVLRPPASFAHRRIGVAEDARHDPARA